MYKCSVLVIFCHGCTFVSVCLYTWLSLTCYNVQYSNVKPFLNSQHSFKLATDNTIVSFQNYFDLLNVPSINEDYKIIITLQQMLHLHQVTVQN